MITLHSLDQSRALRIVWLLEILGTPYRLQTYRRHPDTLLAPDELKAIHPLGKSPLLDDDGFILAESGVITDYLIQTYGNGPSDARTRQPRILAISTLATLCRRFADAVIVARTGVPPD